jgi:hypothetical protein
MNNSGWPHLDAYNRVEPPKNKLPRRSIFKFGSFKDFIINAGKLIAQFSIFWFVFWPFIIFFAISPEEWGSDQVYLAVGEIVKLITYTISVFLTIKILDGSDFDEIGLKRDTHAVADFFAGVGIVFVVQFLQFIFFWITGMVVIKHMLWQDLSVTDIFKNILATFVIFTFVGWSEELLSRGFHLRIISKGLNRPLGIILSSVIFSYMHHDNPGIAPADLIMIFLAGLLMALAFLRTGQLWLAIGLHAGWDFFVTVVFYGGSISGLRIFHLMDIAGTVHPLIFFLFELLALIFIALGVYIYTSRRKVEITDW